MKNKVAAIVASKLWFQAIHYRHTIIAMALPLSDKNGTTAESQ